MAPSSHVVCVGSSQLVVGSKQALQRGRGVPWAEASTSSGKHQPLSNSGFGAADKRNMASSSSRSFPGGLASVWSPLGRRGRSWRKGWRGRMKGWSAFASTLARWLVRSSQGRFLLEADKRPGHSGWQKESVRRSEKKMKVRKETGKRKRGARKKIIACGRAPPWAGGARLRGLASAPSICCSASTCKQARGAGLRRPRGHARTPRMPDRPLDEEPTEALCIDPPASA